MIEFLNLGLTAVNLFLLIAIAGQVFPKAVKTAETDLTTAINNAKAAAAAEAAKLDTLFK